MSEVQLFSGVNSFICLAIVSIAAFGAFVVLYLKIRGSKSNESMLNELVLGERQKNSDGYTSVIDKSKFLNSIGVCVTDLRPAGTISIDGEPLDVISDGNFVKQGSKVKIINVDGSRVLVRPI